MYLDALSWNAFQSWTSKFGKWDGEWGLFWYAGMAIISRFTNTRHGKFFYNEWQNYKINESSDIYCARRDRRGALKFSLRSMPISSVVYQAVCHPISSNRNHVTQPKRNLRHAFQAKSKSMKRIYRLKNEKSGKRNDG